MISVLKNKVDKTENGEGITNIEEYVATLNCDFNILEKDDT